MPHRSIRTRLSQSDTWLLELFLGLYTTLWGLGFANPLTEVFATNPVAYAILGRFPGGEVPFGLFVAVSGVLLLTVTIRATRLTRGIVCAAMGVFWACVLFAIAVPTQWAAGGLPHFGLVALAHWFCWIRLSYRGLP